MGLNSVNFWYSYAKNEVLQAQICCPKLEIFTKMKKNKNSKKPIFVKNLSKEFDKFWQLNFSHLILINVTSGTLARCGEGWQPLIHQKSIVTCPNWSNLISNEGLHQIEIRRIKEKAPKNKHDLHHKFFWPFQRKNSQSG